jgi:hypothetical protein
MRTLLHGMILNRRFFDRLMAKRLVRQICCHGIWGMFFNWVEQLISHIDRYYRHLYNHGKNLGPNFVLELPTFTNNIL